MEESSAAVPPDVLDQEVVSAEEPKNMPKIGGVGEVSQGAYGTAACEVTVLKKLPLAEQGGEA